ncbi:hypothetical protein [Halomonas llamarensis]|uniref:Uncharacterized protein n=1 Tax=Halomonas llamarensis TaxID=2945104 RepID=A0ABT0STP9_9GAMM|nr:hypothetical protein [Halomonas llamarensis]MCL7931214.1 hypothetical protein [Halomonas llamarensis]
MPAIKFRASGRTLTNHDGFSIINQNLEIAGVDNIDSRFATSQGVCSSNVVKNYLGLLYLGTSDLILPSNRGHNWAG